MWNPEKVFFKPISLCQRNFGWTNKTIWNKCRKHYCLTAFKGVFFTIIMLYAYLMLKINIIDFKVEAYTFVFPFATSMFRDAFIVGNVSIFEDLVIRKIGFDTKNFCLSNLLTIWYWDLKTKSQMLSIPAYGIGICTLFDRYQPIFLDSSFWHLQFNYLKMIWKIFYLWDSETEI